MWCASGPQQRFARIFRTERHRVLTSAATAAQTVASCFLSDGEESQSGFEGVVCPILHTVISGLPDSAPCGADEEALPFESDGMYENLAVAVNYALSQSMQWYSRQGIVHRWEEARMAAEEHCHQKGLDANATMCRSWRRHIQLMIKEHSNTQIGD